MSGIPSWAVRGAKVVAIEASSKPKRNETNVVVGFTYTIREVVVFEGYGAGLRVEEIVNPIVGSTVGFLERAFPIEMFRPLVPQKTEAEDLAHFRHHLDQRQPVDA